MTSLLDIEDLELWEDEPPPERDWIVPDLIPRGAVTTLWGPGGVGKSTLALDLQAAMSTPEGSPALWAGREVAAGASLGVYAEDDSRECVRRIRRLGAARGLSMREMSGLVHIAAVMDEEALALLTEGPPVDEDFQGYSAFALKLLHTVWKTNPRLVVLDHLQAFYAADNVDRNRIARFMRFLGNLADAWGAAIVLIAHPSLDGAKGRGYGGSAAWHDYSRSRLYLEPIGKPDSHGRQRLLLSSKKSNYGPPGEAIAMQFDGHSFTIIEGAERPEPKTSSRHRIGLAALRQAIEASPEHNGDDERGCTLFECWRSHAYRLGISNSEQDTARRQAFRRTVLDLKEAGLIEVREPFVWLNVTA